MTETKIIPSHWHIKKLGEVCQTTSGGTPNRGNSKYYQGNIPWVKSGELNKGLILETEEKITEEAIKNSSAKIFPKGTLLIALYGATIGKLAFLGIDAATNQAVCGIYKNDSIDSNYLFNFLIYKKPSLVKQGIGGAQPNISQGILKNLDIPLPPLNEQNAIVAKIDELLSELENGKQQFQIAQKQLKVYRQSLLSAGTSGVLTKTNNAFVNSITIGQPSIKNTNWKTVKLIEVAKLESGHTPRKDRKDYWINGDVFWLSLQDIRMLDGKIAKDTRYKTNKLGIENSSARLLPLGTVCFCRDISLGYVTIMGKTMSTSQHFANWICGPQLSNKFLMYAFMASRDSLIRQGQGTTVKTIYMPDLKEMRIQLPPLEEQNRIVDELESKLAICDNIDETIGQSLKQAETLRQSILKQAFEGRLI